MSSEIVLITGATAGIGRHVALHLARKGHHVFATGRNAASLASLEAEAAGLRLETLRLDVTDADSIEAARSEIDRRTGGHGVDVLVNNAGYGCLAPMELVSDADLRAQFETNVFGLMAVTRAFLPGMHRRGAGKILNVSSVGGRVTLPFFGAYNATKYAVESMSDALRNELWPFGIRVALIEPGVIRSEFADRSMEILSRYDTPDSRYAAVLERAQKIKAMSDKNAAGPEHIARIVERAIRARNPAARYVAPFSAKLMIAFAALLPTRLVDVFFRVAMGLTKKRIETPRARLAAAS